MRNSHPFIGQPSKNPAMPAMGCERISTNQSDSVLSMNWDVESQGEAYMRGAMCHNTDIRIKPDHYWITAVSTASHPDQPDQTRNQKCWLPTLSYGSSVASVLHVSAEHAVRETHPTGQHCVRGSTMERKPFPTLQPLPRSLPWHSTQRLGICAVTGPALALKEAVPHGLPKNSLKK